MTDTMFKNLVIRALSILLKRSTDNLAQMPETNEWLEDARAAIKAGS